MSIVFCYKYSVSKADFRQAANRCTVVLQTDKRVYTNKVYLQVFHQPETWLMRLY